MPRKGKGDKPKGPAPAARPFWAGTLTFGLVSVPVDLYPARRATGPRLRLLAPDGVPLSRRWVCPEEGKEVPRDELVRGYEVESGRYVLVEDDELEALEPKKSREIDLELFVDADDLAPLYFDRAYYLTPTGHSNKAYRLLADVLERTHRAGIARFILRGKEYLVALLAEGGILRAETLRFPDEIRTPEDIGLPEAQEPDADRVAEFEAAIAELEEAEIDPEELHDEDQRRLEAVLARRRKKRKPVVTEAAEDAADDDSDYDAGTLAPVVDLMEVLKRQLGASSGKGGTTSDDRKAPKKAAAVDLSGWTKDELYAEAQKRDLSGRSSMSKAELVNALS